MWLHILFLIRFVLGILVSIKGYFRDCFSILISRSSLVMASPSAFDSASFLDHLADAAESISQVVSDQDVLVNQARCEFGQLQRVVKGQSDEIHELRELLS